MVKGQWTDHHESPVMGILLDFERFHALPLIQNLILEVVKVGDWGGRVNNSQPGTLNGAPPTFSPT